MSDSNPAGATVPDLIHLREQLTGWIARLDEVGPQASTRVAERVRADYADRLRRVNEELAAHRGEIEADLARFRAALSEAEDLRARAADELDELGLRHLIGELDEAAWDETRPGMERRVADADDAVARARAEVDHLQQLAADIAGSQAAAAQQSTPAAPAESYPPTFGDEGAAAASAPVLDEPAPASPEAEPQPSIFAEEASEPARGDHPEAATPVADVTQEAPPGGSAPGGGGGFGG